MTRPKPRVGKSDQLNLRAHFNVYLRPFEILLRGVTQLERYLDPVSFFPQQLPVLVKLRLRRSC